MVKFIRIYFIPTLNAYLKTKAKARLAITKLELSVRLVAVRGQNKMASYRADIANCLIIGESVSPVYGPQGVYPKIGNSS